LFGLNGSNQQNSKKGRGRTREENDLAIECVLIDKGGKTGLSGASGGEGERGERGEPQD